MREIIKLIAVLTTICAISAGLLALVKNVTQEARDQARREETLRAIRAVLPAGYDNEPDMTTVSITDQTGQTRTIYLGFNNNRLTGYAFETSDPKGYGGKISLMLGLTPDGTVVGIEITDQKETPGLGTKISDPEFRAEFQGKSLTSVEWKVQKDGGPFSQFAGATISPRSVVNAVNRGLHFFKENKSEIESNLPFDSGAGTDMLLDNQSDSTFPVSPSIISDAPDSK